MRMSALFSIQKGKPLTEVELGEDALSLGVLPAFMKQVH